MIQQLYPRLPSALAEHLILNNVRAIDKPQLSNWKPSSRVPVTSGREKLKFIENEL